MISYDWLTLNPQNKLNKGKYHAYVVYQEFLSAYVESIMEIKWNKSWSE